MCGRPYEYYELEDSKKKCTRTNHKMAKEDREKNTFNNNTLTYRLPNDDTFFIFAIPFIIHWLGTTVLFTTFLFECILWEMQKVVINLTKWTEI